MPHAVGVVIIWPRILGAEDYSVGWDIQIHFAQTWFETNYHCGSNMFVKTFDNFDAKDIVMHVALN